MYQYSINNLTEDFAKKLTLYSSQNYFKYENNCFDTDRYTQYVNIIINSNNLNIKQMIDNLNDDYKSGITIKHDKLEFEHTKIDMIGSKLYKELWAKNSSDTFQSYIDIIENKIDGHLSQWLDINFADSAIKNNYLDGATYYIIKNQNNEWKKAFQKIDYENHSWLRQIPNNDIPENFNDIYELYFWFKKYEREEVLFYIGNNTVKTLLRNLIVTENHNPHFNGEHRVIKILRECRIDYITCGEILTSDNIELNSLLLSKFEYSLFGFLNLYNFDSSPREFDEDTNYRQEWQEMLAKQLVDIFFLHFAAQLGHQQFSHMFFKLLNYMTEKYIWSFGNDFYHYKANYTLLLILEKLPQFTICISPYKKISLFNLCIKDLVALQLEKLEKQKNFDVANYFLLSYYLKQMKIEENINDINYSAIVSQIVQAVFGNLSGVINNDANNYIKYDFIDKIDFGLMYQLSDNKNEWLKLLDIIKIKNEWLSLLKSRQANRTISSSDPMEPREKVEFYFQILLIIFDKTNDENIAKIINELAITFGLGFEFGIFEDFHIHPKKLYDKYAEKLNLFNDNLFNTFLTELLQQKKLKSLLQLLSHTISKTRQTRIEEEIQQLVNRLDDNNMGNNDIRESILYANNNTIFRPLASKLIATYQVRITNTNHTQFKKEFAEVVCKKELLDIYYSDDAKDEKFNKLNAYQIPIDDKNWGKKSKQVQCENYQNFIRAIMFFEDEPEKTYRILHSLLDKEVNSLYLINMVNAYFHAYKNDKDKVEKYNHILKQYEGYNKKLPLEKTKSLFEYQVLLYGYNSINDTSKILQLYKELPLHYKEHMKDDLPIKLQIFDSTVNINNKLIVCVEGEFDIKFLKNINKHIKEYREIIDLEKEQISFIDLGGSRLEKWAKEHHLEGSNILELHIYDSDIGAGQNAFKYQKHCQIVNNRKDSSICFLTKKREMENYIHKLLIEKEFVIDMSTISNWDEEDIPTYILNKGKMKDELAIKNILNGKLTKLLTRELIEDVGGFDEIKSWFEKIKELNDL